MQTPAVCLLIALALLSACGGKPEEQTAIRIRMPEGEPSPLILVGENEMPTFTPPGEWYDLEIICTNPDKNMKARLSLAYLETKADEPWPFIADATRQKGFVSIQIMLEDETLIKVRKCESSDGLGKEK